MEGEEPSLTLVDNSSDEIGAAIQLLFLTNSTQLIVALRLGGIQILNLEGDSVVLSQTLDTTTGTVILLIIKKAMVNLCMF